MTRRISDAILTLLVVLEGRECPEDVARITKVMVRAFFAADPHKALNLGVRNLRRMRQGCFYNLHLWLERPEILDIAKRHGAYWAWKIWKRASIAIHRGSKASFAFGMDEGGQPDKGGHPYEEGFSVYADAAMYAELMFRSGQCKSEEATTAALDFINKARKDPDMKADRRRLQRYRKTFKSVADFSSPDELFAFLKMKYPFIA